MLLYCTLVGMDAGQVPVTESEGALASPIHFQPLVWTNDLNSRYVGRHGMPCITHYGSIP